FPSVAALAMDDRGAVGVDRGRAQQKAGRRQRHVFGRVLVEAGLVRIAVFLAHRLPSWPRLPPLLPIAADSVECGRAACLRSVAFLGSKIEVDGVRLKHPSLEIAMHDEMI